MGKTRSCPSCGRKCPGTCNNLFKDKALSPEESDLQNRKVFLNYLRMTIFMLIFSPVETL